MHKSSYSKMEWFKNTYLTVGERLNILDVGSLDKKGNFNYRSLFNESNWKYTGLDVLDGNNVDIVIEDIYNWFEIEDNTYDVIISGQFFEHLEYFWLTMSQIERVLKPGGYICIIAPSAGGNHGNLNDCYRFYEDGFRALAKYVNLEVLHCSTNNEAKPWCDTCLVAHKAGAVEAKTEELENRMDNLEDKLDLILEAIKNK